MKPLAKSLARGSGKHQRKLLIDLGQKVSSGAPGFDFPGARASGAVLHRTYIDCYLVTNILLTFMQDSTAHYLSSFSSALVLLEQKSLRFTLRQGGP